MERLAMKSALDNVRETAPLVHNITNYVTVNDCANALLAIGASPIMSDEPADVADIAALCGGLNLNIGTLNQTTIGAMRVAGRQAAKLGHPIVLDPVGAGASSLRTETAGALLDALPVAAIRCNMSEAKAVAGAAASTRGVDVNPDDAVREENVAASAAFVRSLAARSGAVVAVTGAIDIVADADRAFAVRNGHPLMGRVTGTGCMLSALTAAFVVANPERRLESAVAAVAAMGLAGQQAAARMQPVDGNGSFRTYLLDALCNLTGDALAEGALIEALA